MSGDRLSRAWRWVEAHPPPGPFRPGFFRSPLRGPWLTSVLGLVLLVGVPVMFVTGLLSYAAYKPDLVGAANDLTPGKGFLGFYLGWFDWPTRPSWIFRVNQGTHVLLGLALVPIVLAKLWSVLPKFFVWPPARSVAEALERITLFFLVGGIIFELVTGLLNIQYWYVFPTGFYTAHLYGAWVFMSAFVLHAALRVPVMMRSLRSRETLPEPFEPSGLVSSNPAPATISRRGALGMIGAGSALLVGLAAGQTVGGDKFRRLALLAPRGGDLGSGPNDFPINKTAASAEITTADIGPAWRLVLVGGDGRELALDRDELLAMDQHTYRLPIACVEGWSTVQDWTGVRLNELAGLVDSVDAPAVVVESVQRTGTFRAAVLRGNQIADERSLLALAVNTAPLSADHGYPARVIVPGNPGVHNTKWVGRMTFRSPENAGGK